MNMLESLYKSTVIMAAPIILASLGGLITYYAGIINVAMEGMILASAFAAVVCSYLYSSWVAGVAAAIAAGVIFSLLYSFFVTTLKADNFAIGFALNIFIASFTVYLTRVMFVGKNAFNSPDIQAIPKIKIDFGLDLLNILFSNFSILVYLAVALTFAVSYMVFRTPYGLWLRAAGSFPEALATAGKKVGITQYAASIMAGALCGLAGAQLSISNVVMFNKGMSSGRGFMCLAIILIAQGKPKMTLVLSVVFGMFEALAIQLRSSDIPSQFLSMFPYVMAICTLILLNTKLFHKKSKVSADKG
jgi:general nucleoside transport system permease protein